MTAETTLIRNSTDNPPAISLKNIDLLQSLRYNKITENIAMKTDIFSEVRQLKDKVTLGKFIQSKRKENGLSQKELAEKLYVTESAVSKWERGVSYPDITMISGICEALNISERELCNASEDSGQRRLEQMAAKYTRFKWTYNIILALCYLSAIIPCFISFVVREHCPSKFFILLTSLMMTASILNVPMIVERNKALTAFGSFYGSLNLLLLSGSVYSGEGWFFMAFLGVALGFGILFLPFIVRCEVFAPYAGNSKALICMAADTVLLLGTIAYGTLRYGTSEDLLTGGITAVWCLVFVWGIFAVVRYLKINIFFKLSAGFAIAALWIISTNPVLTFILNTEKVTVDDFHSSNIVVAAVGAGIAALFAAVGGAVKIRCKKD